MDLTRITLVMLLAASGLPAQSVDEIVNLAIVARGGRDRIKAIRTQRISGRLHLNADDGTITVDIARPESIREEFVAGTQRIVRASNGRYAWMKIGNQPPQPLPLADARSLAASADIEGPLVDYKEKGTVIEYGGIVQVSGRPTHQLLIHPKTGPDRVAYIDAKTWLDVKWEGKITSDGKEYTVESFFADYRNVDGVMCAFAIESNTVGTTIKQLLRFDRIQINVPMAATHFLP